MTRATISLTMIAKDAESSIARAISTASDLVDEVVVAVDTRTVDRTKEVALELGARAVDFQWTDSFADARNTPIEHARFDWIFWLDSDEWMDEENRGRFKTLAASLGEANVGYVMSSVSQTRFPLSGGGDTSSKSHARCGCFDAIPRFVGSFASSNQARGTAGWRHASID